jgi:predicted Zn-dependent protease
MKRLDKIALILSLLALAVAIYVNLQSAAINRELVRSHGSTPTETGVVAIIKPFTPVPVEKGDVVYVYWSDFQKKVNGKWVHDESMDKFNDYHIELK